VEEITDQTGLEEILLLAQVALNTVAATVEVEVTNQAAAVVERQAIRVRAEEAGGFFMVQIKDLREAVPVEHTGLAAFVLAAEAAERPCLGALLRLPRQTRTPGKVVPEQTQMVETALAEAPEESAARLAVAVAVPACFTQAALAA
jgi:hypothetical protein